MPPERRPCLAALCLNVLVVEDITSLALIGFYFHSCLSTLLIEMEQSYRALVSTDLMGSLCCFEKSMHYTVDFMYSCRVSALVPFFSLVICVISIDTLPCCLPLPERVIDVIHDYHVHFGCHSIIRLNTGILPPIELRLRLVLRICAASVRP